MGQTNEALIAVIGPSATLPDAAERQIILSRVQHGAINGHTTGLCPVQHLIHGRLVVGKTVKGQRRGAIIDEGYGFIQGVIGKYRQQRTGLEPATPGVTGRYSNRLNYRCA